MKNWIKKTLTDDKGDPSLKRQMAFLAFIVLIVAIFTKISPEIIDSLMIFIGTLLELTGF